MIASQKIIFLVTRRQYVQMLVLKSNNVLILVHYIVYNNTGV